MAEAQRPQFFGQDLHRHALSGVAAYVGLGPPQRERNRPAGRLDADLRERHEHFGDGQRPGKHAGQRAELAFRQAVHQGRGSGRGDPAIERHPERPGWRCRVAEHHRVAARTGSTRLVSVAPRPSSACPSVRRSEGHTRSGAAARPFIERSHDRARKTSRGDHGRGQDGQLQRVGRRDVRPAHERDAMSLPAPECLGQRQVIPVGQEFRNARKTRRSGHHSVSLTRRWSFVGPCARHMKFPRYS